MSAYARQQHKRHGKHQKHTKHFLKVYSPYLPLMAIVTIGMVVSVLMPPQQNFKNVGVTNSKEVLAYATSMSAGSLLQSTNQQRTSRGLPALKINSQLQSAAQAKANDMVSRDYWAHDPPYPGEFWWQFVKNAGYKYKALGENLAYGFADGQSTVAGWMASPEHKDNMLNASYTEVGFGYKNGSDFNNSGQETVVVAEYGLPLSSTTAASPAPTSSTGSTKAAESTIAQTPVAKPVPKPAQKSEKETDNEQPTAATTSSSNNIPPAESSTVSISRLAYITGGNLPWLATAVSAILLGAIAALALRHTIAIRKWFKKGERYVLHHALFDVTIIALIGLCVVLNQSANMFVR